MSEVEYHLKFKKANATFSNTELTFSINHIKSRELSSVYYIFRAYDMEDNLLYTYESDRWLIDSVYRHNEDTFNVPERVADNSVSFEIELITIGITSENPLYFNEAMFQEGTFTSYHMPKEAVKSWEIKFNKNNFANLYTSGGDYLQIIRPLKDSFFTDKITKSECTVLAPHLYDEPEVDNPINVFLEFNGAREQRIEVLR